MLGLGVAHGESLGVCGSRDVKSGTEVELERRTGAAIVDAAAYLLGGGGAGVSLASAFKICAMALATVPSTDRNAITR